MPQTLLGATGAPPTGQVDFRLARNALVSEFRKGRVSRDEVCYAHPELMRAARNVGETTDEPCPICEQVEVVLVSYVFGPGLPASGQCVTSSDELGRLSRRARELACYVVEVCPECAWNHLARTFPVGRRHRG
ncbi:MAG TPA: DUF5318 family protein [Acidimicrobiales bacterium]|nr:DUF5318 family protein [Acidimicrobiales bacterium]